MIENLRPALAYGKGREYEVEYEAAFGGKLVETMGVVINCSKNECHAVDIAACMSAPIHRTICGTRV